MPRVARLRVSLAEVRQAEASRWEVLRDLRRAAFLESPDAFASSAEAEVDDPEELRTLGLRSGESDGVIAIRLASSGGRFMATSWSALVRP